MCCTGPKWKREVVPDHKFDFVDTKEFHSQAIGIQLQYTWLYVLVVKSFLVYISDIYTATTMLTSSNWSNKIYSSCKEKNGCVAIPFGVAKWLFVGCIIFSFLLLAYEARKAKKIIASRDISFAFTNIMAQNYYSLRSYDHFCFFCHINDSTKKKDDLAFFIFFTFKEWKRLLLADGPRQTINALTLYSFYLAKSSEPGPWWQISKYMQWDSKDMVTDVLLVSMTFTVLIFIGSLLLLIVAAILYVPLLCYIRGNLKEYCCHKVDKRITEIIKRKQKQRLARQAQLAKKEAAGDFSHLKGKGGMQAALPQPTLPSISLDDDEDDLKTVANSSSRYANSVRTAKDSYWSDRKDTEYGAGAYMPDYPPMPAYDPNAYPPQPGYAAYATSLHDDGSTLYGDHEDYNKGSVVHGSTTIAHQDYGSAYANDASGHEQHRDRYTPDPYGTDPYGRNDAYAHAGYDAQAGYDANAHGAYGQAAYSTDPYGGAYQQAQQTHYDDNAAQYHQQQDAHYQQQESYYQQQDAYYHQQQDAPPYHQQQQQQEQPPHSQNGSRWDGGQAY